MSGLIKDKFRFYAALLVFLLCLTLSFHLSIGDFTTTIRNISKDIYNPTIVQRYVKSVQEAIIQGLPDNVPVLGSLLQWRLITKAELTASDSAEGTLVSQGTAEWVINRRSIAVGVYQVKFFASFSMLQAFDYGFIQVVAAPLRAIIDGGSSVRWGSAETVSVDGSLSYDGDIGPGNRTGLTFAWFCRDSVENATLSNDCFGAFVTGSSAVTVSIDTSLLTVGKTYVLKLTLSKDDRSSFAEMSFEIAAGEIPQVILR